MTPVDEIKRQVRLCDVAAQYGELRKRGQLQVCRCLCGENSDRNPSFTLYEHGQPDDHFHCFACGRHGSVIDLVMLVEHLDFKAACQLLRDRFMVGHGYPSPRRVVVRQTAKQVATELLPEVKRMLEATAAHYNMTLKRVPTVLTNLHKRGLHDTTLDRLAVGYADGSLARHLHGQGHSLSLAAQMGLIGARAELMQNRIVFPICNAAGEIAFLIGRATGARQPPKYLGLPDGLVHKLPMCVGRPTLGVIVVEGPFDLAALAQWGVDQHYLIIALLGTAHTRALEIICKLRPERVLLALDQDLAGTRAARELQDALAASSIPAIRLVWPGAKDCGELMEQGEAGKALFLELLPTLPLPTSVMSAAIPNLDDWLQAAYEDRSSLIE